MKKKPAMTVSSEAWCVDIIHYRTSAAGNGNVNVVFITVTVKSTCLLLATYQTTSTYCTVQYSAGTYS